jgi:uncharacterized protein YdaU (DUF1376 family)
MMTKQPFLPLYFSEILAEATEWGGEEISLYVTLLGYQWVLGSLPSDPAKLCRVVRWDRKLFDSCWEQVRAKFGERDGRLLNFRLEKHREHSKELSAIRSAIGSRGGSASSSKRKAKAAAIGSSKAAPNVVPIATAKAAPNGIAIGASLLQQNSTILREEKNEEEESEASHGKRGS